MIVLDIELSRVRGGDVENPRAFFLRVGGHRVLFWFFFDTCIPEAAGRQECKDVAGIEGWIDRWESFRRQL